MLDFLELQSELAESGSESAGFSYAYLPGLVCAGRVKLPREFVKLRNLLNPVMRIDL